MTTADTTHPAGGFVFVDPDPRAFAAGTGEYPVSGDKIARHLDGPHPDNGTRNGRQLRRMPIGDLLWSAVAAMPHPGRR